MPTREQAAQMRAQRVRALSDRPSERRAGEARASGSAVRAVLTARGITPVKRGDLMVVPVGGYASVTESPYEMYDFWGPYTEVVSRGAFEATLAASPLVEFTVNHGAGGGLPMASTRNGTLELAEDDTGLDYTAFTDPTRGDVANLLKALERGDQAEASFKFRITSGQWSPDYTEYRINAVDINGGDVSSVNFGANPAATSGLRSADHPLLRADLRRLSDGLAARALSPADTTSLTVLLTQLAAADAAFDPIVDAICGTDCALDAAQMTLAAMLGLPDPDVEDAGMQQDGAHDPAHVARDRMLALIALELAEV